MLEPAARWCPSWGVIEGETESKRVRESEREVDLFSGSLSRWLQQPSTGPGFIWVSLVGAGGSSAWSVR